jgi:hypothetical protein
MSLPVQPVAEAPYSSVIGVLAICAPEFSQELINIFVCQFIAVNERCQKAFIELVRPWG